MKALFFFLLSLFFLQNCEAQKAVVPKFNKPTAVLNKHDSGMLYAPYLFRAIKIDVVSGNNNREDFVVKNYSVAIIRMGDTIFNKTNIVGNKFTNELKSAFKTIGHGGKLIFYSITAEGLDKKIIELAPMKFTITKK